MFNTIWFLEKHRSQKIQRVYLSCMYYPSHSASTVNSIDVLCLRFVAKFCACVSKTFFIWKIAALTVVPTQLLHKCFVNIFANKITNSALTKMCTSPLEKAF